MRGCAAVGTWGIYLAVGAFFKKKTTIHAHDLNLIPFKKMTVISPLTVRISGNSDTV